MEGNRLFGKVPSESTAERRVKPNALSADRGSVWKQVIHQATVTVIHLVAWSTTTTDGRVWQEIQEKGERQSWLLNIMAALLHILCTK